MVREGTLWKGGIIVIPLSKAVCSYFADILQIVGD